MHIFEVNMVPIFVAAVLSLALGTVWYSSILFGVPWMRAVGLTEAEVVLDSKVVWQKIVVECILRFILMLTLTHFIALEESFGSKNGLFAAGLIALLVVSTHIGAVLWERKPLSYFYITASYHALVILCGAFIILRWPW